MKSLITPAFQELDPSESRRIIGGAVWFLPILGAAAYQLYAHWDHFKQGLSGEAEQPEIPQN